MITKNSPGEELYTFGKNYLQTESCEGMLYARAFLDANPGATIDQLLTHFEDGWATGETKRSWALSFLLLAKDDYDADLRRRIIDWADTDTIIISLIVALPEDYWTTSELAQFNRLLRPNHNYYYNNPNKTKIDRVISNIGRNN